MMEHHSNSCLLLLPNFVAVSAISVSDCRPCVPLAGMSFLWGHFSCQFWLLAAMRFLTSLSMLEQSLLCKHCCTCNCPSGKLLQHHQHGRGDQSLPNQDTMGFNQTNQCQFHKRKGCELLLAALSKLLSQPVHTNHLLQTRHCTDCQTAWSNWHAGQIALM